MSLQQIDAKTLHHWLEAGEALLVDVREPAEYAAEHIPGATLLPLGQTCCAKLPQANGKKLVIHCRKGARGSNACSKLMAEDPALTAYNLEGGIEAWAAAGYPIAKGTRRMLPLDRQVQLTIGASVLTASILVWLGHPAFVYVTGFFGAGLTFAGLTGFCGLARVLAKMPWNQRA